MDSNVVIDFFNGRLPASGKDLMMSIEPSISVITQIELLSNKDIPQGEKDSINSFIAVSAIHGLNEKVVQQTILLRQQRKLKTPDAIIAATAIIYNLVLLTRNVKDFNDIPDLKQMDPHTI